PNGKFSGGARACKPCRTFPQIQAAWESLPAERTARVNNVVPIWRKFTKRKKSRNQYHRKQHRRSERRSASCRGDRRSKLSPDTREAAGALANRVWVR